MIRRQMLRHTLATLAYRGGKAIAGVDEGFGGFRPGPSTRTPVQILGHIGDLLDWALSLVRGQHVWHDSPRRPWSEEIDRFFQALRTLDEFLASDDPVLCGAEQLFQGPIADAFTHIGQIALLRRLYGNPVKGENYFKAEIVAGRLGPEQSSRRVEFD